MSLLSVVLIGITLFLTTRAKFLETLFVGLDKVYQVHRILGAVAFVFLIDHPLLLAAKSITAPETSLMFLVPGNNVAFNFGIFSLYLFILTFIFIVFFRLPYNIWRFLHRVLGLAAILGFIHILTIGSDIGRFLPLKVWLITWMGVGFASLFYIIFLYQKLAPRFEYQVEKIERELDMINIWLKPTTRILKFAPGQFVYTKFLNKTVGGELHPFSISSGESEGYLRLSIKVLGDYTLRLPDLKIGDKAHIFGPYGCFGKNCAESCDQCWIGGGVGITPFLSMLRQEAIKRTNRSIALFYCFRDKEEAVFSKEIASLSSQVENIAYTDWPSAEKGRISAEKIVSTLGGVNNKHFLLCGPKIMMETLRKQFLRLGVPESNIHYEKFDLV